MFGRKTTAKLPQKATSNAASNASGVPRPKLSLLSLESRLMFDAAATATASEVNQEQVAQEQAEVAVSVDGGTEGKTQEFADSQDLLQAISTFMPNESRTEVVFVDPTVPNYQDLLSGMDPNIEIIILDGGQDGIEQLAGALAGRTGIDAIHLISHGGAGELQLGTGTLTLESMSGQYADELATIRQVLSGQADILVYGCDFAEGDVGQAAVNQLALLTGADVEASSDLTGNVALGGDWDLEVQTGAIETQVVINYDTQANWVDLLSLTASGSETRVNTTTTGTQTNNSLVDYYTPDSVAMDASGNYVSVWESAGNIYGQRYNSAGTAQGSEFIIASNAANERLASVDMNSSGAFVVTWERDQGTGDYDIYARLYNSSGTAVTSEFLVNETTTYDQQHAHVALAADGTFIVVFESNIEASGNYYDNIYAQRYDAIGTRIGSNFVVNTTTTGDQDNADIAMDSAGNFVVVWESERTAGGGAYSIYGQRYNSSGVAQGGQFLVNSVASSNDLRASIAMNDSGSFVVTWDRLSGGDADIQAQRFNSSGVAQGSVISVTSNGSYEQEMANVAMDETGNVVVSWMSNGQDGSGWGVYARQYDSTGSALTTESQVATTTAGRQDYPGVAYQNGKVVVTWSGNGTGDTAGIFMQRYTAAGGNAAPTITSNSGGVTASISVAENTTTITTVTATDADAGAALTYSISGGADSSKFTINSSTGALSFISAPNYESPTDSGGNNVYDVIVTVTDGVGGADSQSIAVTVTNANDAPVLADTALSITVAEDAGAPSGAVGSLSSAFTGGITDQDSGAAKGIAIVGTNETNGTWYYTTNGGSTWTVVGAVSSTSALLLADNGSTRLYFAPGADYNGTVSNAITVHAWDQTSGSNGARVSLPTSSNTVLDSMSSASFSNNNGTANWSGSWIENDAAGSGATTGSIDITSGYLRFKPTTVGNSLAREVDLSTATSATFSFSVPTSFLTTGQILVQVSNNGGSSYTTLETITSASATGTYSYDISSYMASNTRIRFYASVADSSGIRIDDVQVQYSTGSTAYSTATDTIAVAVTAVNDGPSFTSLNGTPTYTEGGSPVVLDSTVTITDTELTAANNFNGATLTLSRNGGANSQDVFSGSGTLSLSGGNVVVGGTTIGTYTNSSGTLAMTFNGSATNALVNSAMQQIAYSNSSEAPPSSVQVNWTFSDGNGGSQGTGGAFSATGSVTVSITAVNDAPVLTDSGLTFTVLEDAGAPVNGTAVGVLLSTFTGNITDPDGAVAKGIAIVGSTETNGTWYYTTDAGATWLTVGAVSDSASLLLADTAGTRLYFAPNSNYTGNVFPGLIVRAWDQSSGAVGTKVDTSVQGGSTAFSVQGDTIDPTVIAVNDPPVFGHLDGTPTFTEGGAAVVLDSNVSITDVELSAANNFNGATLTLARNGGANAEDVFSGSGTLSLTSGNVVVSGTTIGTYTNSGGTLQFTFNANATNTLVNSAIQQIAYSNSSDAPPASVQVDWTFSDGNSGGQGSGGALTATGSTTVTITGVNDAPTITNLSGDSLSYSEGAGAVVIDQGNNALVTDIDSANFNTGTLTVSIPVGGEPTEDVLTIRNQGTGAGQIGVSGFDVSYEGMTIGTFTGGAGGTDLVVTLNGNATATAVTALVKNITYEDINADSPAEGGFTIRFVLTDGAGGTSGNYDVSALVAGVNDAPTDLTLSANTVAENAANGTVVGTATGTDPDTGDTKTYSFTDSAGGRFAINSSTGAITVADGSLLNYEAATSHSVTVRVTDSGGLTYDEIFTINLTNVNEAPTGADATVTINEDSSHILTTANLGFGDVDAGDSLSAVRIDTLPGAGSLTLSGVAVTAGQVITVADITAGNLVFTPAADANGTGYASFTFSVRDSNNTYDAAPNTLTVDVTAVNDAPIRTAGTVSNLTLSEDAGLASLGLGGVIYSPGGGADESGQTLTYAVTAIPSASVGDVFLADGTTQVTIGSYTLADIQGMQFKPAANASGVTAFQFNVYDSGGTANGGANTISQFILITVTAVNDAPTITNLSSDSLSYNEGDGAVLIEQGGNALVADVDSSNLDTGTLTVSIPSGGDSTEDVLSIRNQGTGVGQIGVSGSNVTYGGVTIGTFTGGSSGSNLVITLNSNATPTAVTTLVQNITYENTDTAAATTGARTVRFVLTDGDGGTSPNYDTTVTVSGANDAPVNTVPGAQTVNEDIALAVSGISVNDVDGNLSTVQLGVLNGTVSVTLQGGATISGGSNGTNTVTLSGSQADINATLATLTYQGTLNYNGPDTLTITSTDTNSGSDVDTVAITVTAVDDAPVVTGGTSGSGAEDTTITNTLTATDVDGLSDGTVFTVTTSATNGTASIDPTTGLWSYTPTADFNGSDSFTVTITDDAGNTATQVISVTVSPVVDITNDSLTTAEDTAISANVLTGTNGATADSFEGTPVLTGVTQGANGSVTFLANGTVTYTPNANFTGTDSFTYTITSGGMTETATVTVTVTAVNDAPVVTGGTSGTGPEDTMLTGTLTASDADGLSDGSVFTVTTAATNGTASIDPATGLWSYTPNPDFYGTDSFTVTITDDVGNSTTQVIMLSVTPENDAPLLVTNTGSNLAEGGTDTIDASELAVTDVDNSAAQLTYTIGTGPAYGRLELTTAPGVSATTFTQADIDANRLVYIHNGSETTSDNFTFTVNDGAGGSIGITIVTLTITPVNDAPTITSNGGTSTASINVAENVSTITIVTGADVDLPAQALTYSVSGGADQARFTINAATGALSFTAPPDFEVATDANSDNVYVVQVQITDSQGGSTTQTIQVTVTDVTESVPLPPPPGPTVPPVLVSPLPLPGGPTPGPGTPSSSAPVTPVPMGSGPAPVPLGSTVLPVGSRPISEGLLTLVPTPDRPVAKQLEEPKRLTDDVTKEIPLFLVNDNQGRPLFSVLPVEPVSMLELDPPETTPSVSDLLLAKLDEMTVSLDQAVRVAQEHHELMARVAAVTGTTLSVGFVAWALRSGAILASCLATMPAWRHFDPLPVVKLSRHERRHRRDETARAQQQEAAEFKGLTRVLDEKPPLERTA
ncbi:MAG: tandem-95 repeat protein [Nitrospira sp.]|nr:tandem-95 repeat protein [Nitrospira sp.]